ncbi:MAG TPA: hypothetical protein VFL91_27240 [Thermomicrobiales bacterium]|nr:hypothetical protein [Thermomicrobiales bacterium]
MDSASEIREEMVVVDPERRPVGVVEAVHGDGFDVRGLHLTRADVAAVAGDRVRLRDSERVRVIARRLEVEAVLGVNAPPGSGFAGTEAPPPA